MISSFIGWLIVGAAIAYASRNAVREKVANPDGGEDSGIEAQGPPGDRPWCEALETLCGGACLILDSSLKLVAAGANAQRIFECAARDSHLIDIIPADAVEAFLEGIAAAKRVGRMRWQCPMDGRRVDAAASAVGESHVAIVIGASR